MSENELIKILWNGSNVRDKATQKSNLDSILV